MRKSLSMLMTLLLLITMFTSVAFADDGQVFVDDGDIDYNNVGGNGTDDGDDDGTDSGASKPVEGVKNPDGSITSPDGTITKPDGTVTKPDGTVVKPDGTVTSPDGTVTKPDGTVVSPDGTITSPDGTITKPDGTVIKPETGKDVSGTVRKSVKGFYTNIYVGENLDSPPKFVLDVWDVQTDKSIGSINVTEAQYNKVSGFYELVIPTKTFKTGDKLALVYKSGTETIEDISMEFGGMFYVLKKNQHMPLTVVNMNIDKKDDGKLTEVLSFTEGAPLVGSIALNTDKLGFKIETSEGVVLKKQKIAFKALGAKVQQGYTTDDKGYVWIPQSKVPAEFYAVVDGYEETLYTLPTFLLAGKTDTQFTDTIVVSKPSQATANGVSTITPKIKVNGNTDLSKRWVSVNVKFKGSEAIYEVNAESGKMYVPQGSKIESVTSEYAVVEGYKLDGSTLNINIKPKYTLVIWKEGKAYDITIVNVDNKSYKGKDKLVFGIVPGESFMVKDNTTGLVFTVDTYDKDLVTTYIVGEGVVGSGGSNPHTGDNIFLYVGLLLVALVGGTSFFLYRRKMKMPSKTAVASMLMILMLLTTMLPTVEVEAAGVGGSTPGSGSPSINTVGKAQVTDKVAIMEVGFVVNDGNFSNESNQDTLRHHFKFAEANRNLMFYFAPDQYSLKAAKNSGSGVITFNAGSASGNGGLHVETLFGKNPLFSKDKTQTNSADFQKRLIQTTPNIESNGSGGDFFINVLSQAMGTMKNVDGLRALSGEYSNEAYGQFVGKYIDKFVDPALGGDVVKGEQYKVRMFNEYLDMVKAKGLLTGDAYSVWRTQMESAYSEKKVLLVMQTMIGVSTSTGGSNYDARPTGFLSMHDAVVWLKWQRNQNGKNTNLDVYKEHLAIDSITNPALSSGGPSTASPYSQYGNLEFTMRYFGQNNYAHTLQPETKNMKSSTSSSTNPFGGWGFHPFGGALANTPLIYANYRVKVKDADGNLLETVTIPVTGWQKSDNKELAKIDTPTKKRIQLATAIPYKDDVLMLNDNSPIEITMKDVPAKDPKVALASEELINKVPLLKSKAGSKITGTVILSDAGSHEVILGEDTPEPRFLGRYLGGMKEKSYVSGGVTTENKYFELKAKDDSDLHANAEMTIIVEATLVKKDAPAPESDLQVPQWTLSKYFNDISPKKKIPTVYAVDVQTTEGCYNPELIPSGTFTFPLVNPTGLPEWAESKTKLFEGDTNVKPISINSTVATFILAGDLLAIKHNYTIDNVMVANWKGGSLLGGKIQTTVKGQNGKSATNYGNHVFEYKVASPVGSWTLKETCKKWKDTSYTGSDGKTVSQGVWEEYFITKNAPYDITPSKYDVTVQFDRYLPKASVANTKADEVEDADTNAIYWETNQVEDAFSVNPEVLMLYENVGGGKSTSMVAGDKLRLIEPVTYNIARYVDTQIITEVTSPTMATAQKAKALAGQLGAPKKGVFYKGATTATNFEASGDIEFKTWALDIGNTALKNSWNPGTKYNTDEFALEFMDRHGDKASSGKWEVPLKTDANYKINSKDYSHEKGLIKAKEIGYTVVDHDLEIRGGKLNKIDGQDATKYFAYTDASKCVFEPGERPTKEKDLGCALARMNITTDANVFNTLEANKGHNVSDGSFASLGNAVRGTTNLATGKPWYNEDTTVVVLREYTRTFDTPSYMYTNKIPLKIPGLEEPIDKTQLFMKGYRGHSMLTLDVQKLKAIYDTSENGFGGASTIDYIVPNSTVIDSFN